jgi:hypothetical protein
MVTIAIDCGDQLRKGHTALTGDLLQTVPELVFEADARLVACNDNRALRNRRLHGFSPANQASVLYDRMALRTRKPPGLVPPGERLSRDWERRAQSRQLLAEQVELALFSEGWKFIACQSTPQLTT